MSSKVLAGRYELLEQIGEGGMSVVYKGRCKLLNRYVAIKILKKKFTKDIKLVESFKKESQAAASLMSNNIVSVYDVGKEGNINYIVMELIEGKLLSDVIAEKGNLRYKETVEIAIQIASGLACAHNNNIIHKDIKPHNILIADDGTVKIADFGIAKFIDNANATGDNQVIVGSVHYFSPEQARGSYVDEKSDIYSLGIVMYEMLTGTVPFDGDDPIKIALKHINEDVKLPSELVGNIPPTLERIIMKCLNKIQVNRYATAENLLDDLKNIEVISNLVGEKTYTQNKSTDKEITEIKNANEIKSGKNSRKEKKRKIKLNKMKIAGILMAVICTFACNAIVSNLGLLDTKSNVTRVPELKGLTLKEAEETLEAYKLELKIGDEIFDNEFKEGVIVSQVPKSKAKVKKGNSVRVNISKGTRDGTAPNLIGKKYVEAVNLIEKYGYRVGTVSIGESIEKKDTVIEQTPKPGEAIKKGKTITFVVSSGIEGNKTVMPKIVGLSYDEAKKALENAELDFGDFAEEMSETVPIGNIIWQQYGAGEKIDKGTKVNYKISTGNQIPEPKAIAMDVDYALAKNAVFFITVNLIDETGTHNIYNREQRLKENESETLILNGTGKGTVSVLFDNTEVISKNLDFNTGEIE